MEKQKLQESSHILVPIIVVTILMDKKVESDEHGTGTL